VRRARGKGDKDDASTPTSSTPDPEELKLALARARTRLERSRKGLPALVEENESEGFTSDEVVEESSTAENGDLRRIVSDWFGAVGGVFDSLNSDDEAMDARDENPAIAAQDDASSSRDDDEDSSAARRGGRMVSMEESMAGEWSGRVHRYGDVVVDAEQECRR
jgi:hypothetical protein